MRVPYRLRGEVRSKDREMFERGRGRVRARVAAAVDSVEALAAIRSEGWRF
jgi:hypothetical protein